jgi:hypothetical protein
MIAAPRSSRAPWQRGSFDSSGQSDRLALCKQLAGELAADEILDLAQWCNNRARTRLRNEKRAVLMALAVECAGARNLAAAIIARLRQYERRGPWRFERLLPEPHEAKHLLDHRALRLFAGKVPSKNTIRQAISTSS